MPGQPQKGGGQFFHQRVQQGARGGVHLPIPSQDLRPAVQDRRPPVTGKSLQLVERVGAETEWRKPQMPRHGTDLSLGGLKISESLLLPGPWEGPSTKPDCGLLDFPEDLAEAHLQMPPLGRSESESGGIFFRHATFCKICGTSRHPYLQGYGPSNFTPWAWNSSSMSLS